MPERAVPVAVRVPLCHAHFLPFGLQPEGPLHRMGLLAIVGAVVHIVDKNREWFVCARLVEKAGEKAARFRLHCIGASRALLTVEGDPLRGTESGDLIYAHTEAPLSERQRSIEARKRCEPAVWDNDAWLVFISDSSYLRR